MKAFARGVSFICHLFMELCTLILVLCFLTVLRAEYKTQRTKNKVQSTKITLICWSVLAVLLSLLSVRRVVAWPEPRRSDCEAQPDASQVKTLKVLSPGSLLQSWS